jgi:hypothetical protein
MYESTVIAWGMLYGQDVRPCIFTFTFAFAFASL